MTECGFVIAHSVVFFLPSMFAQNFFSFSTQPHTSQGFYGNPSLVRSLSNEAFSDSMITIMTHFSFSSPPRTPLHFSSPSEGKKTKVKKTHLIDAVIGHGSSLFAEGAKRDVDVPRFGGWH